MVRSDGVHRPATPVVKIRPGLREWRHKETRVVCVDAGKVVLAFGGAVGEGRVEFAGTIVPFENGRFGENGDRCILRRGADFVQCGIGSLKATEKGGTEPCDGIGSDVVFFPKRLEEYSGFAGLL